jgi:hypothetical protein
MRSLLALVWLTMVPSAVLAQLAPEIGYLHPAGAHPGTTVDVVIGGYDWTPDTQIFIHDERIKLEIVGPPSEVLVPEPPYWFGNKARGNDRPLPREFPARLTVAPDVPPGFVKFQVANANGASPPSLLHIINLPSVLEEERSKSPQVLKGLPVAVSGRIRCIEEIDRYEFTSPVTGPLTVELFARRLGSPLFGFVKVFDEAGNVLVDKGDVEGRDLSISFIAQAEAKYTVTLHDVDYAGDRSYVYRLAIMPGPRVVAAFPAAGKSGETREVEFLGLGLATGANQLESLQRPVSFGAAPEQDYVLETPGGKAVPFTLRTSQLPEHVKPAETDDFSIDSLPCAVTSSLTNRPGVDRYLVSLTKDQTWSIRAVAQSLDSTLDLELAVLDATGAELARNDDAPDTTNPSLSFAAPSDGTYSVVVSAIGGRSGERTATYRMSIEPQTKGFAVEVPSQLAVQLGASAKLPLKIVRHAGFDGPVQVSLAGQPLGIKVPQELTVAENASDLAIELTSEGDAAAAAGLAKLTATATIDGQTVTRTAPVLIAAIMKPRVKIVPEGLDDVRKVHRGSTFLAPVLIERLEGFQGEVVLEMTAKQQRSRQGMTSGEFIVPPEAKRVEYPIFVPEWMETTKTSRMILNGAVKVPDPKGNVRTLLQRQGLRIGLLPEGALMKLGMPMKEIEAVVGKEVVVPLSIFRAAGFRQTARLEVLSPSLPKGVAAEPVDVAPDAEVGRLTVRVGDDSQLIGEHSLKFRATAHKEGKWPVVAETSAVLIVNPNDEHGANPP